MRRAGARTEISSRVSLRPEAGPAIDGWALNASRGGVRIVVEGTVELGAEYTIQILGGSDERERRGRVVWLQEEADGTIAGLAYVTETGALHSQPPPPPDDPADTP